MPRNINPSNTTGSEKAEYHFQTLNPGAPIKLGWKDRVEVVADAGLNTQCVHAGVQPDPAHGAVMPPIYHTSTFAFRDIHANTGFDYTRSGNPTREALEEAIAVLEGGKPGVCTNTGMSAILVTLNLLDHGSHLICTHDCYGGTFRMLNHLGRVAGLKVSFVNMADLAALKAAIRPETRMIWIETPSNPLLNLTDLRAVAEIAKGYPNLLTVVDNTFLSPARQRPLELGMDLSVHSTTKYLNGHSDVVGGAIVAKTQQLGDRVFALANVLGLSQAPLDCFFVLRGIKTLELRMRQHETNALAVAKFLAGRKEVSHVYFPGLPTHPQHELAKKQQTGFGGMLSFRLAGGLEAVKHLLRRVKLFTLAESLGGVESLICHPASMTHFSMTPEARAKAGITDDVIRLSIGIEDPDDLISDLAQGLESLAELTRTTVAVSAAH